MAFDPPGKPNFGWLTNVSIVPEASAGAIDAAVVNPNLPTDGLNSTQTFELTSSARNEVQSVPTVINNNVIKCSDYAMEFPIL